MVVEMVAREIGEYPSGKGDPIEPPLVQAVRRRFHGDMGHPTLAHGRQRGLEIDWPGRRKRAGGGRHRLTATIECPQCANAARRFRFVEQVTDQASRGGLAVGSGHADQGEVASGMSVPRARQNERGPVAVAHDDFGRGYLLGYLDQDGPGTPPNCVTDEAVAIRLRSTERDVQHPWPHRAAVYAETGEGRGRGWRGNQEVGSAELVQQRGPDQGHRQLTLLRPDGDGGSRGKDLPGRRSGSTHLSDPSKIDAEAAAVKRHGGFTYRRPQDIGNW